MGIICSQQLQCFRTHRLFPKSWLTELISVSYDNTIRTFPDGPKFQESGKIIVCKVKLNFVGQNCTGHLSNVFFLPA